MSAFVHSASRELIRSGREHLESQLWYFDLDRHERETAAEMSLFDTERQRNSYWNPFTDSKNKMI